MHNQVEHIRSILAPIARGSSQGIKRISRDLGWKLCQWTAPFRLWPDFIIIGSQKCGTSSLYQYLVQHPWILPARKKEVHYFDDVNYHQGSNWYRAHFSLAAYETYLKLRNRHDILTGEASPYYLAYPRAPERIARVMETVKLIVMLRNPVDRAFSHYYHQVRKGREGLSFEEAIEAEEERLRGEREKILRNGNYYSYNFWAYSYLTRGIYIEQIEAWMKYFTKEQFLILKSEDFFSNPEKEFNRTLRFLELPNYKLQTYSKVNAGSYDKMSVATRKNLLNFFRPYNERLYNLVGQDYEWD